MNILVHKNCKIIAVLNLESTDVSAGVIPELYRIFTSRKIKEVVDIIMPDFITHVPGKDNEVE
jgi:hypothetical protein